MTNNRPKRINLSEELKQLCKRNKDGSPNVQRDRLKILYLCGRQLKEAGFYNLPPRGLKAKHVKQLVKQWRDESLSAGTIKNRMSCLRWWAEKVGKSNVIERDNSAYGIPERRYVTNQSKAVELDEEKLARVSDPRIRCSLKLQKAFGLRRKECLKIQPDYADRGDTLVLKATWTKGGKARELPIRTDYQREVLNEAHVIAGKGSMIPPEKKYVEQLHRYEGMTKQVGLSKMHGLRHAYAQERYKELSGMECPACGGKKSRELSPQEKALDRKVRLQISRELGHEREEVTAVYCGR
jgi:hypothetical protein